jgi:dephospho-CoA kinase
MITLGITGTLGAGKGTVVEYLVEKKNFVHFSVREFLLEEIRKLHLPENRDSMVVVANNLRNTYGSAYIVNELYKKAIQTGKNAIIESIRNVGEIEALKQLGTFYLIAVDAKQEQRYKRIILRNSETDVISFEEFVSNEHREMQSDDPSAQNIQACIELADIKMENNTSKEELYSQIEQYLSLLMFKE